MILLIGSLTQGLILALLALGVLISYRVLAFRDLTVDGSITLGGAVAAAMIVSGAHPLAATAAAFLSGFGAGMITGVLHTKFRINGLLAGILVMTALYSINLHVMGKSNVPLLEEQTVLSPARGLAPESAVLHLLGWDLPVQECAVLVFTLGIATAIGLLMFAFFCTNIGLAMRATGDNPQMIRALGVNVEWVTTLGLGLSNGLVALSGALLVQYQGFADLQMGIGMVVWGFASVMIGESLVRDTRLGILICGAVMGSVLFRLLLAIALRWGLNPNDLKLVTAVFVLAALVAPDVLRQMKRWKGAFR
jgi:putative ABC transport system permease protein